MSSGNVIRPEAGARHAPISLPGWRIPASRRSCLGNCSLIIPTYNRPDEISALLELLCQRDDTPAEVVIVDGSTQAVLDERLKVWRKQRIPDFDLVYVKSPSGLTRQRNVGIDISTRQIVFFLDDDSAPLDEYFSKVRDVFESDTAERIGAVGGSVVNELDRPISRRWRLRLMLGLVPRVEPMMYDACGTSTPKGMSTRFQGIRPVDVLPGCAFTFRRRVLKRHRFSAFFEGYSQGEDMEMSLRVQADWEIVCCGSAEILHLPAAGGRPPDFRKAQMEVRNRFFIWKRHRPNTRWIDRIRFWLDIALIGAFDILHAVRRPWKPAALAHAAGIMNGAVRCLTHPPRYVEPFTRKEYRLAETRKISCRTHRN